MELDHTSSNIMLERVLSRHSFTVLRIREEYYVIVFFVFIFKPSSDMEFKEQEGKGKYIDIDFFLLF